jgi:hypothetical protein
MARNFNDKVGHLRNGDIFVTRRDPGTIRVVKEIYFSGNAVIVQEEDGPHTYHDYADVDIIRRG